MSVERLGLPSVPLLTPTFQVWATVRQELVVNQFVELRQTMCEVFLMSMTMEPGQTGKALTEEWKNGYMFHKLLLDNGEDVSATRLLVLTLAYSGCRQMARY